MDGNDYRSLFNGLEASTPLLDGTSRVYLNLDNAASTPSFKSVQQAVNNFLVYYSSVHRGSGFKSQLSTHAYEQARQIVLEFVGADPDQHTCIFVKNTTEAVNKLSQRFPFTAQRDVVLTSALEHHSNDLPWRAAAHTVHIPLEGKGEIDESAFDRLLAEYAPRLALVAISGASNVTGFITPIHRLARKTHAAGGMIFVDCAQLAPHRSVDIRPLDDPEHLDFIAISAHKMYAPFGTGALVGRKETFSHGDPDMVGGGTVEIVTLEDVVWAEPPDKEEAGSPNTVGAVALAAAIRQLQQVGLPQVAAHEAELTTYALERLQSVPGIQIYGEPDPRRASERLGVIPLKLKHVPHFLVAAVLGHEFGIGVRSGCFCAHPYILHLLGLTHAESRLVRQRMLDGDRSDMPGLIRASFGLYNTIDEVERFIQALTRISRGEYTGTYTQDRASGEYIPQGWQPDFSRYFAL
jgi:cysteine desulfurase / selenocysteine lyase